MKTKWLAYFQDVQREHALRWDHLKSSIDYGEIIYRSSEFLDRRWVVASYKQEFNVFVEYLAPQKRFERLLAATFVTKERAVGFAAEMFLICCGRLNRSNRRNLTKATDCFE